MLSLLSIPTLRRSSSNPESKPISYKKLKHVRSRSQNIAGELIFQVNSIPIAPPLPNMKQCSICLEKCSATIKSFCNNDKCNDMIFCLSCVNKYFNNIIHSMYGSNAPIKCPGGCNTRLLTQQWRKYAGETLYNEYAKKCQHQVQMKCGGCHTTKSLMSKYLSKNSLSDKNIKIQIMKQGLYPNNTSYESKEWSVLWDQIDLYRQCKADAVETFNVIETYLFDNYDKMRSRKHAKINAALEDSRLKLSTYEKNILNPIKIKRDCAKRKFDGLKVNAATSILNSIKALRHVDGTRRASFASQMSTCIAPENEIKAKKLSIEYEKYKEEYTRLYANKHKELDIDNLEKEMKSVMKLPLLSEYRMNCIGLILKFCWMDIERQVSLFLRLLVKYPLITTQCCKKKHCFRCKIKDGHPKQTCAEYQGLLNAEIRFCNKCGVALVKGDGCDSLTCICGQNIAWSTLPLTKE